MVDSGCRDCRINNDTLARFQLFDMHLLAWNLLSNKWRDVGLEASCANAHYDDSDNESGEGGMRVSNNGRRSRCSENDMTGNGDEDGDPNSVESAQVCVRNVGTEEWLLSREYVISRYKRHGPTYHDIHPELVECCETSRCLLAEA
jgi:hypothetical protein